MSHTEIDLKTAARRALLGRCPCCGQGKLMRAYLKQVENCAACGESFVTPAPTVAPGPAAPAAGAFSIRVITCRT